MKHGKKYVESAKLVDRNKLYDCDEALETVIKQCELYADSDEFDSPVQSFVQYEIDNTDYSLAAEP